VLLLDDTSATDPDLQLRSISHGVISLDRLGQEYGVSRRRIQIVKLRGSKFRDGYHDYTIETGGLKIFPRLVAGEHRSEHVRERFASGLGGLDALLGGGLRRGTSTLIMGPAGSGKSCVSGLYLNAAARRGEHAAYYIFEESRQTFLDRMTGIGIDIRQDIKNGAVTVRQIDPAELSPGEFTHMLRSDVEEKGTRVVVIDSLNGYINAMPNERFLLAQLHEVLAYLAEKGVLSLMVVAQQGMIGAMQSPVDLSYLADTLILLRFFEHDGSVRKAISVIKHRSGAHEQTIRELNIDQDGVHVGAALRKFRGILTGVPEYLGPDEALMKESEER
jgi:circadian clock protein KaiC